ncbi:hypothetical protein DRO54_07615 [Candidatus Bathyarchaeota archaeon]|nr:MAG: hypothetical protein DRO54_07615 [Candidatus Bathyarchaeota archaeon]
MSALPFLALDRPLGASPELKVSNQSFESRLPRRSHELQKLRGLAELLDFNPEESTQCKILKLRELLSQGLMLREA